MSTVLDRVNCMSGRIGSRVSHELRKKHAFLLDEDPELRIGPARSSGCQDIPGVNVGLPLATGARDNRSYAKQGLLLFRPTPVSPGIETTVSRIKWSVLCSGHRGPAIALTHGPRARSEARSSNVSNGPAAARTLGSLCQLRVVSP